jgi:hypothetical protein
MTLSELKNILPTATELNFQLPDGTLVARHFHVTEVGQINKHFIDCGGTERFEKTVSFQLWETADFDHRLAPKKLNDIISLSESVLKIEDAEIEVEYQGNTIGKYGLEWDGNNFLLTSKQTACLASDKCGIPAHKQKIKLQDLSPATAQSCCTPGGGCC